MIQRAALKTREPRRRLGSGLPAWSLSIALLKLLNILLESATCRENSDEAEMVPNGACSPFGARCERDQSKRAAPGGAPRRDFAPWPSTPGWRVLWRWALAQPSRSLAQDCFRGISQGRVLIKSGLFRNRWLPQTTCALCRKLRRSSAAVATSREGHRSRRSDPAGQHQRWGRGRRR